MTRWDLPCQARAPAPAFQLLTTNHQHFSPSRQPVAFSGLSKNSNWLPTAWARHSLGKVSPAAKLLGERTANARESGVDDTGPSMYLKGHFGRTLTGEPSQKVSAIGDPHLSLDS